jgi:hypothetical protein
MSTGNSITSRFLAVVFAITRHAFVITTGFAALLHSTWTLATVFNGIEPQQFTADWYAWIGVAFLAAFAIDVGQIAISVELRSGERTRAKYIAFTVLACATYFMQWWYVAHHIPDLSLGNGLRAEWAGFARLLSDAAVWIVPGLLPAATIIYTFSYAKPRSQRPAKVTNPATQTAIIRTSGMQSDLQIEMPGQHEALCEVCGWTKSYATPRAAINAKVAHDRHHHPALVTSGNGRH